MKRFTETEMDVTTLLGLRAAVFDTVTARERDIESAAAEICKWFDPGRADSDAVVERIVKLIENLTGDETPGRIANLCMDVAWWIIIPTDKKMHQRLLSQYSGPTFYAAPRPQQEAS